MRKLAAACALASLALLAGCGSDDADTPAAAATGESSSSSPAAAATPSDSAASSAPDSGSGSPTVLTGTVGSDDDPDAFVITLTDSSGQEVTTLPAGDYTIEVHDLSAKHNFHLTGGEVDEKTAVPDVVDTTFDVTLTPGDYTFKCDPHPPMTGSFTVS
jgi:plastocyanin